MKSIFLNKKISRRIETGHPWIFGNEVNTGKALDAAAKPGEIVYQSPISDHGTPANP
jgi:PUA-like domain